MQKQTALKQCQKRKLRDEKQFHQGENKNHWNVRDILRTGQNIPGLIIFTATCSMAIRFFFVCVCVCVWGGGGGGATASDLCSQVPKTRTVQVFANN